MSIIMMNRILLPIFTALFAGCVTYRPTPLPPDHPASPSASEAVTPPARRMLTVDATTRATRERFAAVEAAEKSDPNTQDHQMHNMQAMPGMQHGAATGSAEQPKGKEGYTFVMHPQVQQDQPGNCPICGMKLVKKQQQPGTQHEGH
jgi:hypothetical protein